MNDSADIHRAYREDKMMNSALISSKNNIAEVYDSGEWQLIA